MKYSIILIAAIAFILGSCGNAKKSEAAHGNKHDKTECSDHDHASGEHDKKTASQEEFVVDSKDSTLACPTEKCAGCQHSCPSKTEVVENTDSDHDHNNAEDQSHEHDNDGDHTHN